MMSRGNTVDVENITTELQAVRRGVDRFGNIDNILSILKCEKRKQMTQCGQDAFLIKAICECYKNDNYHRDIVLMSLGLLSGYSYKQIATIGERQEAFLLKTNYLMLNSRSKVKDFSAANKVECSRLKNTLSHVEEDWLNKLASYLVEIDDIENYVDDIDKKYDIKEKGILVTGIFPTPSYAKGEGTRYTIELILRELMDVKRHVYYLCEKVKLSLPIAGATMVLFFGVFLIGQNWPFKFQSDSLDNTQEAKAIETRMIDKDGNKSITGGLEINTKYIKLDDDSNEDAPQVQNNKIANVDEY